MLKVLHICYGVGTGGVEAVIYNYYSHIDQSKVHFDVVAQKAENDSSRQMYGELLEQLGCKVFFVPPKSENLAKNLFQLGGIIRTGKYDILHIHMGPASLPYVALGKFLHVENIIVHVHGAFDPTGWSSSRITRLQQKLLEHMGNYQCMACTKVAATQLWGENTQVFILHNAFEIEKYCADDARRAKMRDRLGIEDRLAIVDVGRLSEGKQPLFMIDIFSALQKVRPDSVLFMVGTGEMMQETKEYAKKHGLDETQVRFLGGRTDVAEILQAMDVFVLPTLGEGLGIVYMEAQAAGLPCFAPKGCVPQEVAITPMFHEVEKPESLQAWVDAILSHANERLQESPQQLLREAGYDICLEAGKLERYYEKLCEGDTDR